MRRGVLSLLSGNLVGKLIGVARELVLAALFGTSAPVSALRVASTGTFVPMNLFTADALSVGFLPNHSRMGSASREAIEFYRVVSRLVLGVGLVLAVLLVAFREAWVFVLAPGLPPGTLQLAAQMLGVMAVGVPFYLHSSLAAYLEVSCGGYLLASVRPAVQSGGLIIGTMIAFWSAQPLFLAAGFTLSYAVLSGISAIRVRRRGYARSVAAPPVNRAERRQLRARFLRATSPMLWAQAVVQSAWIVERAVTSFVSSDAVAAIDYARMVTDTAMSLIAAPLGIVMLSSLASLGESGFRLSMARMTRKVLLVSVPLSAILFAASVPLVTLIYARGAFGGDAVAVTASFLAGLAIGLWAQVLSYTHVKGLNSRGRNREAAVIVACGAASLIAFQLLLVGPLGAFGVGLGVSLASICQLVLSSTILGQSRLVLMHLVLLSPILLAGSTVWLTTSQAAMPTVVVASLLLAGGSLAYLLSVPPLRRELLDLVVGRTVHG